MNDFVILLFGHTRPLFIADVLESLKKQNALHYVHVWLDGNQGSSDLIKKNNEVASVVSHFPVARVYRHNGLLGFRKLLLQALSESVKKFKYIMVLEDDCFPTHDAVEIFQRELKEIENKPDIFSIYGHPFLVPGEKEVCPRFQGWGWGTTAEKLKPFLEKLIDCYSITEEQYLQYVETVLSDDILRKIDITPQREASKTLKRFFAWDETLTLLTALENKVHKKTSKRTIYNFGASLDSSRFKRINAFLEPPFNMVAHEDIWKYF